MKIYLIDFENVKSKGLTGVDHLTEEDSVIIFYSENADTISFEMHQKVLSSKAEVEYFKVHVGGKNALDFQLSTLLGYLVGKNAYSHIFVISNDKSFDFLHDFWHGKYVASPDCVVYRSRTIAQAITYAGGKTKTAELADTADDTSAETAAAEIPQSVEEPAAAEAVEDAEEAAKEPAAVQETAAENTELTAEEAPAEVSAEPAVTESEAVTQEAAEAMEAQENISEAKTEAAEEEKPEKPEKPARRSGAKSYSQALTAALAKAKCSADDIALIGKLLASSDTKEEFHNSLAKEYKQDATDIYKLLRPKYLRLKEMYVSENNGGETAKEQPVAETVQETKAADTAAETPAAAEEPGEEVIYQDTVNKRLAELLDGICTDEELATVTRLFNEAETKQKLYIRMVKAFRKSKGCKFYNAIKGEYSAIAAGKQGE